MSRIVTITLSALMLAGCATESSYDKAAVPDAAAAMRQAMANCEKEQAADDSYAKFTACQIAAQRDFAVAIHLTRMEAFDAYAVRMMALAADRDAGRMNLVQVEARAASIRNDYWVAFAPPVRRTYDHAQPMPFYDAGNTAPVANSGPSSLPQP